MAASPRENWETPRPHERNDVDVSWPVDFLYCQRWIYSHRKADSPELPWSGLRPSCAPRSYAGVDDFDTTEGGVTFDNVEPPGSPADKAGLVGGDIITTVDGQPVHSDDEMMEILRRIPIGKTVDVVYLRDGETKNTKLTTISKAELDRLQEVFSSRPEGRGQFGYEDSDAKLVQIPNTKMFGVQLGVVLPNRPADLAGIKQGDIVIQFGGTPIRTTDEFLSRVRRAIPLHHHKGRSDA